MPENAGWRISSLEDARSPVIQNEGRPRGRHFRWLVGGVSAAGSLPG